MPPTRQKPVPSAKPHQSPPPRSQRENGKLRNMATTTEPQPIEQRIRLTGVDWETFEKLATNSRGGRFAFDEGVLEIMSPGPIHESHGRSMGEFVRIVTRIRRIARKSLGSTT